MDYNNTLRRYVEEHPDAEYLRRECQSGRTDCIPRSQWSPSTETSFESQSLASTPDIHGSTRATGRPNADHQISTATTMEALGIRVWPPGYQTQSYPAAGHPGAPPPARTYAPTYTTNYGRPLSWNTYGLYLPQYYSLPPEMNSVNDLLPNPVDRCMLSLSDYWTTDR